MPRFPAPILQMSASVYAYGRRICLPPPMTLATLSTTMSRSCTGFARPSSTEASPRLAPSQRRSAGSAARRESSHLGEQVEIALDRWRDLLRRAILVRAALAAEPSFWPLKASVDVDRVLRTEAQRAAWLAHIRSYWVRCRPGVGARSSPPATAHALARSRIGRRMTTARLKVLRRFETHASKSISTCAAEGRPSIVKGPPRPHL